MLPGVFITGEFFQQFWRACHNFYQARRLQNVQLFLTWGRSNRYTKKGFTNTNNFTNFRIYFISSLQGARKKLRMKNLKTKNLVTLFVNKDEILSQDSGTAACETFQLRLKETKSICIIVEPKQNYRRQVQYICIETVSCMGHLILSLWHSIEY